MRVDEKQRKIILERLNQATSVPPCNPFGFREGVLDLLADSENATKRITDLESQLAAKPPTIDDAEAAEAAEIERLRASDILQKVQTELRPWQEHNFPSRPAWQPVMGLAEEVGELSHAFLKREQRCRLNENHDDAIWDALGDILVYACDVANAEGLDLAAVLDEVWLRVSKRDWAKEREAAKAAEEKAMPTSSDSRDGFEALVKRLWGSKPYLQRHHAGTDDYLMDTIQGGWLVWQAQALEVERLQAELADARLAIRAGSGRAWRELGEEDKCRVERAEREVVEAESGSWARRISVGLRERLSRRKEGVMSSWPAKLRNWADVIARNYYTIAQLLRDAADAMEAVEVRCSEQAAELDEWKKTVKANYDLIAQLRAAVEPARLIMEQMTGEAAKAEKGTSDAG
jgi:NTP pyrophosphatase (non-canonical NTP hydrolase)